MGKLFSIMCFCLYLSIHVTLYPSHVFCESSMCCESRVIRSYGVCCHHDRLVKCTSHESRARRLRSHFNAVVSVSAVSHHVCLHLSTFLTESGLARVCRHAIFPLYLQEVSGVKLTVCLWSCWQEGLSGAWVPREPLPESLEVDTKPQDMNAAKGGLVIFTANSNPSNRELGRRIAE